MTFDYLTLIAERHRPGIGVYPYIKYIDIGFDARTLSIYHVRLRGFSFEQQFHISDGPLLEQVNSWLAAQVEKR